MIHINKNSSLGSLWSDSEPASGIIRRPGLKISTDKIFSSVGHGLTSQEDDHNTYPKWQNCSLIHLSLHVECSIIDITFGQAILPHKRKVFYISFDLILRPSMLLNFSAQKGEKQRRESKFDNCEMVLSNIPSVLGINRFVSSSWI